MGAHVIERLRLGELLADEHERFVALHPRSAALATEAAAHLVAGVPMPWMTRWPGGFPIHVAEASGARFVDVDGIEYVDFCLGDTGAMSGHGGAALAAAVARQMDIGLTTMLPTEDAAWVGGELSRRFGLPKWQMAMTATDANRFVLRFARHLTGRPKVAVMDWCYHGTVDETLVILDSVGRVVSRPGAIGPQVDPALTTRVVPFNDLGALERALDHGDVAALLMEPALTNIGIVLPDEGYLRGVRELTRRYGTLLIIDETHTICAGPGGCTAAWDLDPDFVVIGKPIGGGVPVAAYGMTDALADRLVSAMTGHDSDVAGIGGTLTGSALALAAVRATLSTTLLADDYDADDPVGDEMDRRRGGGDRGCRAGLDRPATGLSGGVLVLSAAARRCGGGGRGRRRTRRVHAPVGAESRCAHDAVPQHGADVARPRRRRRRSPHRGVLRRRVTALTA